MSPSMTILRNEDGTLHPRSHLTMFLHPHRNNAQNDQLLSTLIHSHLLSGTAHPLTSHELSSLSPAAQRSSLDGRISELSSRSALGTGSASLKETERLQMGGRQKAGMARRAGEIEDKRLQEAKDVGNYHSSVKHLFGEIASSSAIGKKAAKEAARREERGLGMGVGTWKNGSLRISNEEIRSVEGGGRGGRGGR